MGLATYAYNRSTSGGEIITNLINASDGAGLHFNGTSGTIDIASPPDLGTKFSFEFIIQADSWGDSKYICDFGTGGRFSFASWGDTSYNLAVYDTDFRSFGVKVLDDLKVHHLVMTVDGTAAILYDNGNQVGTATLGGTPNVDSCTDAAIGSYISGTTDNFDGTYYRARFWNKTLSQTEVTSVYESASIDFADQWGAPAVGGANDKIEGDFTYNLDGWDAVNTWNTQTWDGTAKNMDLAANATGQNSRTANQLVPGYSYRVFYTASATAGAPAFGYHNGSALVALPATGSGTSTISNGTQNTFDFVLPSNSNNYFYIFSTTASDAVTIDDIHVIRTGCVSDFDLAFANVTQSTIVQNRNDTVSMDGTAAGGVTQITKLEAVNTNKLNVGGTTPLVGIGVAAGSTPSAPLEVVGNVRANVSNAGGFYLTADTGIVRNNATGVALRTGTSGGTDRLIVDTAGNVGIGVVPDAALHIFKDLHNAAIATPDESSSYQLHINGPAGSTNDTVGISMSTTDGVDNISASMVAIDVGAAGLADLAFSTRGSGGIAEHMRISSAGVTTLKSLNVSQGDSTLAFESTNNSSYGPSFAIDSKIMSTANQSDNAYGSKLTFHTNTNGNVLTERLAIDSAGLASFSAGIAFSGQTDATGTGITSGASTLNHYEEGTWTPVLGGTTATHPAANVLGIYTRIGNLVFVSWYSGSLTLASSSGTAFIGGLPFPVSNSEPSYSVFSYTYGNAVDGNSRGGYFARNTSTMLFTDDGINNATWIDGASKFAMISGVYQTP